MHKTYIYACAISAGFLLAACSGAPEAPQAAAAVAAKSSTAATAQPRSEDLRSKAESAMAAQRLFAPAGDNALEYYLALRAQSPGDPGVQDALTDMQPQLVIAAEQALANGRTPDAKRLVALLTRVNGDAPALPRLRLSVAEAERLALAQVEADSETARAEAQRAQAELQKQAETNAARLTAERGQPSPAAQAPAATTTTGTVQTTSVQAAATTASRSPATTAPAPVQPAAQPVAKSTVEPPRPAPASAAAADSPPPAPATPATSPPAATPSTASATPRLIRDEPPRYPAIVGGRQVSGQVVVGFTISPDGSVQSPKVISSTLPMTYQRAALAAASRWKFEATGRSQQGQRSVAFKN